MSSDCLNIDNSSFRIFSVFFTFEQLSLVLTFNTFYDILPISLKYIVFKKYALLIQSADIRAVYKIILYNVVPRNPF